MTIYTNPDSPVLFLDGEDVNRSACRRPRWFAGFVAENAAVTGAAQALLCDTAITQSAALVGAEVGQGVHATFKSKDRDLYLISQNPSDRALVDLS